MFYRGHGGSRRPAVLLSLFALSTLVAWLLWPVSVTLEGYGIVQPRLEDLVRVIPFESGMVCRVMGERLQEVSAGEPLFEYVPEGKFSVLSYSRMTLPGGGEPEPETLSSWYQKVERERIARIEAVNRWSARALSPAPSARKWESDLVQRLAMAVPREADLALAQAQNDENIRLGRENANKVYTFDEAIGESAPTERGIPFASPVTGLIFSIWIRPRMQIFGAPITPLPTVVPGGPPITALSTGVSSPVAEIMPQGTPLEVMALVAIPSSFRHGGEGWQASLFSEKESRAVFAGETRVEFGRVTINPVDARLVLPELLVTRESVFIRLSLLGKIPAAIGTTVRVRLISPVRPRAWTWLGAQQ
jgi:hypothetical protein